MAACTPIKSAAEITTEWVEEIIKGSNENPDKVESIRFSTSYISDGFLSDISFCEITLKNSSKILSLVVKMLPPDKEMQDFLKQCNIAKFEAYFNRFLMSESLRQFIQQKEVRLHIPHIYYSNSTDDAFTLVMENMSVKGFSRVMDPNGIDLTNTLKAIRAIACFHGTMLAYFKTNSAEQMKDAISKTATKIPMILDSVRFGLEKVARVSANMEISDKINVLLTTEKYKRLFDNPECLMPFTVVHGDFWSGQVLFSTDEACIIDWQFVEYHNPLSDVATFLYLSCASSIFASLTEILGTYLCCLNRTLTELGSCMQFTPSEVTKSLDLAWRRGFAVLMGSIDGFLDNKKITPDRLEGLLKFSLEKGVLD